MLLKVLVLSSLLFLDDHVMAQTKQVETDVQTSLRCVEDGANTFLTLETKTGPISFIDLTFNELGTFVPSIISCNRWLQELALNLDLKENTSTIGFRHVYSGSRKAQAYFIGGTQTVFYQHCKQSMFCKLRFPYSLFEPRAYFVEKSRKLPNQCFEPRSLDQATETVKIDDVENTKWNRLEDLTVGFSPRSTYVQDIISSGLLSHKISFVSSMSLSTRSLSRLQMELKKNPGNKLFLMFDLGMDIYNTSLSEVLDMDGDQIYLVPFYRHPGMNAPFHIKMASSLSSSRVLWTSSNLRNEDATQQTDFAMDFRQSDISSSINKFFLEELRSVCSNLQYAECPLQADTALGKGRSFQIRSAIQRTCAEFHNNLDIQKWLATNFPQQKYIRSGNASLKSFVASAIDGAESDVLVLTSQFSNEVVSQSLESAQKRGLEVNMFTTSISTWPKDVKVFLPDNDRAFAPWVHTKALVIDQKWALVSSGNFTENGLNSAGEIAFVTEDPRIVTALYRYARSMSLHGSGGSSFFMKEYPGDLERNPTWLSQPVVWNSEIKSSKQMEPLPTTSVFRALTPDEIRCFSDLPPSLFYLDDSKANLCSE